MSEETIVADAQPQEGDKQIVLAKPEAPKAVAAEEIDFQMVAARLELKGKPGQNAAEAERRWEAYILSEASAVRTDSLTAAENRVVHFSRETGLPLDTVQHSMSVLAEVEKEQLQVG